MSYCLAENAVCHKKTETDEPTDWVFFGNTFTMIEEKDIARGWVEKPEVLTILQMYLDQDRPDNDIENARKVHDDIVNDHRGWYFVNLPTEGDGEQTYYPVRDESQ